MPTDFPPLEANALLRALPSHALDVLRADLTPVALGRGESINEPDTPLRKIQFPVGCVLSMLTLMHDGAAVEVTTVGCEGMGGFQAVLGAERVSERVICQVPGNAYSCGIDKFRKHFQELEAFRFLLQRYAQVAFSVVAQSVACNRLHGVNQRCARWLLMTHDRVFSDTFDLTQEFLAIMLGSNRPTVSVAAAALQEAGFISYARGHITIRDRRGLESAACECYATTKKHFDRLVPATV